uniref:Uncharacterized protein n=1 Tax=Leersia perrieri TaxID=77586 RepID=A0A0D9XPC6_9ORYZ
MGMDDEVDRHCGRKVDSVMGSGGDARGGGGDATDSGGDAISNSGGSRVKRSISHQKPVIRTSMYNAEENGFEDDELSIRRYMTIASLIVNILLFAARYIGPKSFKEAFSPSVVPKIREDYFRRTLAMLH